MPLRFLERRLGDALAARGREDLARNALGGISLTDDGGTIYVHLLPRAGWAGRAQGRAYVLAWEDYVPEGSKRLLCYRWLVQESKRSIDENADKIIRWLEGR